MKNKELIEKLQQFPLEMEVSVLNIKEAFENANGDEEGSSAGFYGVNSVATEYGIGEVKEFIAIYIGTT